MLKNYHGTDLFMNFMTQKSSDWIVFKRVMASAMPFKNLLILSPVYCFNHPFSIAQPFLVQQIVDVNIIQGQKTRCIGCGIIYRCVGDQCSDEVLLFTSHLFWANQL